VPFPFRGEEIIDDGKKNALRKNVGIAIAEYGLQLFDRTEGSPHSRGQTGETHRLGFETLGEFQHAPQLESYPN
jgi:hypothetical protein